MTTTAICPSCGEATTFSSPPSADCPECQLPFPEALIAQVTAALNRERAPKPTLLVLGTYGSLGFGTLMLLPLLLAPFDIGSYFIDQEPVSGPEFLRQVGLLWTALGGLTFAIGYGLWRERSWTRPVMVTYWLLLALGTVAAEARNGGILVGVAEALLFLAITLIPALIYLYGRKNVREYYARLGASEEQP